MTPPVQGTAAKSRFMYWNPKEMRSCIDMFLDRHADDLQDELASFRTPDVFALKYSRDVRTTANNERSVQATTVRRVFLSKMNQEYQLCGKVRNPLLRCNFGCPPCACMCQA